MANSRPAVALAAALAAVTLTPIPVADAQTAAKKGPAAKIEQPVATNVIPDNIKPLIWALTGFRQDVYTAYLARMEANLKAAAPADRAEVLRLMGKAELDGRNFKAIATQDLYAVGVPQELTLHVWDGPTNKTLVLNQGQIFVRAGKLQRQYMWYYSTPGDILLLDGQAFKVDNTFSSVADANARMNFFSFPGTVKLDPLTMMRNAKTQQDRVQIDIGGYAAVTPLDRDFCTLMTRNRTAISDNDFSTLRQTMTEQRDSAIPGVKDTKIDLNDSPTNIVKDLKRVWPQLSNYDRHLVVAYIIASENAAASDVRNSPAFRVFSTELATTFSPTLVTGMMTNIRQTLGADFDRNAFELRLGGASLFFNFDNVAFLRMWKQQCGPITSDTLVAGGAGFQELIAGAAGIDKEFSGVRGQVAKRLYAYAAMNEQDRRTIASKVARGLIGAMVYGQKKYDVQDGRRIVVIEGRDKREPNTPFLEMYDGLYETAYAIYTFEQTSAKAYGKQPYGPVDYGATLARTRTLMKQMEAEGVFSQRLPMDVAVSYHIKDIMAAFKPSGLFAAGGPDYLVKTREFFEFAYDNATYTAAGGQVRKVPILGFMANMMAVAMGDTELGRGAYAPTVGSLFGIQKLDGKVTNDEQQMKDTQLSLEDITAAMSKLKGAVKTPEQTAAVDQLASILAKAFWAQRGETTNPELFLQAPKAAGPL